MTLLEEIYINLCPEDIVDEMTIAANNLPLPAVGRLAPCATDGPEKPVGAGYGCPAMPKASAPRTMDRPEAREAWPLTLREAIAIALDNSEIVRVITFAGAGIGADDSAISMAMESAKREYAKGRPLVIARLNADTSIWRFKAEVMAELRSVERQYWNLAQAHVQLWAADRAVALAEEVLQREQAEFRFVCRGSVADVAEAAQRLEQFRLDLVARTSDVITTERQLRSRLGLPPADNRRIIPVTPPTEARLEPDWDSSLAQMLGFQPDIVQQRILVRAAQLYLLISRNQLLPLLGPDALHEFQGLGQQFDCVEATVIGTMFKALSPLIAASERGERHDPGSDSYEAFTTWQVGLMYPMPTATGRYPLANTRQAQYALIRSRARYEQIVHQTTHSLARFFLEIDANYKQFQIATRLRKAAAQRLDAQRAYYEEGRITSDRFLDAVGQYTTAVATEAQYQTAYNTSILALEEAKGTLLAYDNVVVAEGPRPHKSAKRPVTLTTGDVGPSPSAR
jgi:outer membrane protein TolC